MNLRYLFPFWLLFTVNTSAQEVSFPSGWQGNWKGELSWYPGPGKELKKVPMQLRIHPADSAHQWNWQLIYGEEAADNRPYLLVAKDTSKGHWVIDEKNGIVLDQFYFAGRLTGSFTVQSSTILNTYRIENDQLIVEFFSSAAQPLARSGKGTDESPAVSSYKINSYQWAILSRTK